MTTTSDFTTTYCPDHGVYGDDCPACKHFLEAHRRPRPLTGRDVFRIPDTADEYPRIEGHYPQRLTGLLAKLPTDAQARKNAPITRGFLDYFPRAVAAVAELSRIANEQHNPGEPMHWAKEKSNDHADCLARHLIERGTIDTDGQRHSTKMAWRAMANLEIELEEAACLKAQP